MKSTRLRSHRLLGRGQDEGEGAKFQPDLDTLFLQARGGNEKAREKLCASVFEAAIKYARARGLPAVYELNDFAQDVVVALLEQFRAIQRLRAWLPPVLFRQRAFAYRRYYQDLIDSLNGAEPQIAAGSKQSSAEEQSRQLAHLEVLVLVDRLPEGQRALMIMHCVDGMPFKDICRILGMNPSNVRMHFLRAKKRLQKYLNLHHGEGSGHGNDT